MSKTHVWSSKPLNFEKKVKFEEKNTYFKLNEIDILSNTASVRLAICVHHFVEHLLGIKCQVGTIHERKYNTGDLKTKQNGQHGKVLCIFESKKRNYS